MCACACVCVRARARVNARVQVSNDASKTRPIRPTMRPHDDGMIEW